MKAFIEEVIQAITTGDELTDKESIEVFAERVAAQQNVTLE